MRTLLAAAAALALGVAASCPVQTARADEPAGLALPVSTTLPARAPDVSLAIVQCNLVVVIYLIVEGDPLSPYVYDKSSPVSADDAKILAQLAKRQEVRAVACPLFQQ